MDKLLSDFLTLAPADGDLSFATLLHHYLNLRRQGLGHRAAVAELRGHDINRRELRSAVLLTLVGTEADDVLGQAP